MKLYPIALLAGLSACASVPSGDNIGTRLASWHDAPATDLVAVLGEPVITKRGSWIWQFPGPGNGEVITHISHSANAGLGLRPAPSTSGSPSDGARMPGEMQVTSGSGGTYTKHVVCKYIAYVEDGMVTELTTLSKPGTHCRFDELPRRSE